MVADGAIAVTEAAQAKVRLQDADGREFSAMDARAARTASPLQAARLYVAGSRPAGASLITLGLGSR